MHLLDMFASLVLISITDIPEQMIASAMSVRMTKRLNEMTIHFVTRLANELRWQWGSNTTNQSLNLELSFLIW